MPIYAYECEECGVRFERRQSFHDEPLTDCPECGGGVHRLIQPAGIVFKGSGFYVTDHRSSRKSLSTASDKTETKKKEKSEDSSKSTKSE